MVRIWENHHGYVCDTQHCRVLHRCLNPSSHSLSDEQANEMSDMLSKVRPISPMIISPSSTSDCRHFRAVFLRLSTKRSISRFWDRPGLEGPRQMRHNRFVKGWTRRNENVGVLLQEQEFSNSIIVFSLAQESAKRTKLWYEDSGQSKH